MRWREIINLKEQKKEEKQYDNKQQCTNVNAVLKSVFLIQLINGLYVIYLFTNICVSRLLSLYISFFYILSY